MVPKGRFELPCPYGHYALNVARLPFRHFGLPGAACPLSTNKLYLAQFLVSTKRLYGYSIAKTMRVILFKTGKGGVGKTSVAAATTLRSILDKAIEKTEEPGETKERKRSKIEVQ